MIEYEKGPYIKRDIKRLKRINSLEVDVENHYKIFRGKVTERITNAYEVPLAQAYLYEVDLDEGTKVLFYKDRCATTNPKLTPSEGLRIVFGLYVKDHKPIKYIPFLVFSAKEEKKTYLCENGKTYKLTSSYFKNIIEAKLGYFA